MDNFLILRLKVPVTEELLGGLEAADRTPEGIMRQLAEAYEEDNLLEGMGLGDVQYMVKVAYAGEEAVRRGTVHSAEE
jgi:hypothetical protein